MDNNSTIPSPLLTSTNDQSPTNYQFQFDLEQSPSYIHAKTSLFDEILTPPLSSPSNNTSSTHSYMNVSFQETPNDSTSPSSFINQHYNTTYRY